MTQRPDGALRRSGPFYADNLPEQVMWGFEPFAVVASVSMQHQAAAQVYRTFESLFHRLPSPLQEQADDLFLRSLSGLGDHIMTRDLQKSLSALSAAGRSRCADAIAAARHQLALSIGRLDSLSTRTQASGVRISRGG